MKEADIFIENCRSRKQYLEGIVQKEGKDLENAPEGTIYAYRHGNTFQYVLRDRQSTDKDRKYLGKNDSGIIHSLVQKEYDKKVLNACLQELKILNTLISFYENGAFAENVYMLCTEAKRAVIDPLRLPDSVFLEGWIKQEYQRLGFREDAPVFYSDKGERMRSKSETIIANLLNKKHIPYHYEKPLSLGDTTVHPDFTILVLRKREEIYWEHFGLMDDHDYREKALKKITRYEQCGLFPGKNLIMTFETARQQINVKVLSDIMKEFFL